VPFEITDAAKEALVRWFAIRRARESDWLFPIRTRKDDHVRARHYSRLVDSWVTLVDLKPADCGTHSPGRTKASLVYKRAGNLRARQLLLGHTKLESAVRCLGIDADEALVLAEQTNL